MPTRSVSYLKLLFIFIVVIYLYLYFCLFVKIDDKDNAENTAIVESTTVDSNENTESKGSSSPKKVQLVSLGEISAIESEIAKTKTDILQLLHNVS